MNASDKAGVIRPMPACGFGLSNSLYSLPGLSGLSNMLGDVPLLRSPN